MQVKFYERAPDHLLRFAVLAARCEGKWIFCRHRDRTTFEMPGGRREAGETIEETAAHELREETGALQFTITPLCAYSVIGKNRVNESGEESFGKLFYAEVASLAETLDSEMEEVRLWDAPPARCTYPLIQSRLMEYARRWERGRAGTACR